MYSDEIEVRIPRKESRFEGVEMTPDLGKYCIHLDGFLPRGRGSGRGCCRCVSWKAIARSCRDKWNRARITTSLLYQICRR